MELKKSIFILITAIFLVSIAGVCAVDANDTTVASEDDLEIDKTIDDVIGVEEDTNLASNEENEILTDAEQTFTQLNEKINGNTNNSIYLNSDYKYSNEDASFKNGIEINRDVNIYGNGSTIDGSNEARIFKINGGHNVVFYNITFINGNVGDNANGGAIDGNSKVINCTFINNHAYSGAALNGGEAHNCNFTDNHATQDGGAVYKGKAYDCTFKDNTARYGGAFYQNEAYNCNFINNTASDVGGAVFMGNAYNCTFTDNHAVNKGGAMYEGTAVLCILKTASDTLYNTNINIPTFTVSKPVFRFDSGDKLLFNLTYDNKNYDGYNTTITLTKDGDPIDVYYALSGSDEGWYAELSPGIYMATLSMEQYAVNPITVYVSNGNEGTYSVLSAEIGSGGGVINLQYDYYVYDYGSSIEITTPNTVIEGNGAIIDMAGSNIRALRVGASNVTIRNLTIKNADFNGDGGAIYFGVAGTVENCTFMGNKANGGGAMYEGYAINCRFIENHANGFGGAINGYDHKSTNCTFIGNTAGENGGALSGGEAHNCSFISNVANNGGAINDGKVYNCNFTDNHAVKEGGAMCGGNAINCTFINNTAYAGAALRGGEARNCNFTDNHAAQDGGAVYKCNAYDCTFKGNTAKYGGAFYQNDAYNCNFINNTASDTGGAVFNGNAYNCTFTDNHAVKEGGAMCGGKAINCTFINNTAYAGAALKGGEAHNCNFTDNHAAQDGGAVYKGKAYDCTFKGNTARYGGAFYENEAYNCNFINNTASENGGAIFKGKADNCNFTDNHAVNKGGAMYEGTAGLCFLNTSSDTLHNTNILPVFTVSKPVLRFDSGDRLLFNLTCDNKNYDGYNTTITLAKDGDSVDVYYALSGSDEGWSVYLNPGIYTATLSMEQYTVKPITVYLITGINEGTYMVLSSEIGYGGGVINLQYDYYVYDCGSSIEITRPNTVIEGNGAIIDMAGSNIRALTVSASNVTIRNLTIKNADFNGDGGAIYFGVAGTVENCNFINNSAYSGAALYGGEAYNCNFTDNHAVQDGGAVYKCKAYDCIFKDNTAKYGGAFYQNEAYNCNFINNTASDTGGAVFMGNAYNCTFTDNHAVNKGGAMYEGASVLNIFKTSSDTLYNTNFPTFTVSKPVFRFDSGDKLLFNMTYDNKNYDGYNTTITLTKDGNPVDVYYALSGSDEGWYAELRPGIYTATLSMEQYLVNPITVDVITGMNVGTYSGLSGEIGSGGGVINLQYDYYVYDYGSSIEITTPNTVIEGNGAIINMAGSNIRALRVSASNVTIRNLTIKNADFNGNGGAIYFGVAGTVENCTFMGNKANGGGAMYEGYAINCKFIENHANGYGGAINGYNHNSINCTFIGNSAGNNGGALSGGEAHNCSFISNVASRDGGAINDGKVYNCNFTGNSANGNGGAMVGGTAFLCILKTASDTLYNTNVPTYTVSKSLLIFDLGDRLLFNFTYDNKNYDGYNTTITLTKDGDPVDVYYALSGSDEGWYAELSPGIYTATLSMEQYAVKPVTVCICNGINEATYSVLSYEIGSGGGVINLQYDYYVYDYGSSIEITRPNTVIEGNGAIIDMAGSNIRALTVSASNVTIRNLTIKNADFNGYGGAVYIAKYGNVINCTFANNTASNGGAIYFYKDAIANVINCTFANNSASNGGAIYFYLDTIVNVINCTFDNNHATDDGGAVYFTDGGQVINCNFTNNAANCGGASYFYYGCYGTIIGNYINNTAESNGGANYVRSYVEGSIIGNYTNNTAGGGGGANYFDGYVKGSIIGNYTNNTAKSGKGGANRIYYVTGDVIGNYINNTAESDGGANYVYAFVEGSIIGNYTNNTAKSGKGGANYVDAYVGGNIFGDYINNTAGGDGGANYFESYVGGSIIGNYTNNTAKSGKGGANSIYYVERDVIGNYINNTAEGDGGANYFEYYVKGSIIGNYTNNTAKSGKGGANSIYYVERDVIGNYINNTAEGDGGANYFESYVGGSIIGNYTNNTAKSGKGGANRIYFVSGDVIGNYINNTAEGDGGANYFNNFVRGSIIGNYVNNTAKSGKGGANYLNYYVGGNIIGNYIKNVAGSDGGAIYSNYSATYLIESVTLENCNFTDNQATGYGGAVYFIARGNILNCNFINNNASTGGAIYFYNLNDGLINGSTFINNTENIIFVNSGGNITAINSWFGNNATNYNIKPEAGNVTMDNWLFLNATVDSNAVPAFNSTSIVFKLYIYNATSQNVSKYNNTILLPVNLTVTSTRGYVVNPAANLGDSIRYVATRVGDGSVTAKLENVVCTIGVNNIKTNLDLSAENQMIIYGVNATIGLNYNANATGKVNITLTGKKSILTYLNLDLNVTVVLPNDVPVDEYDVAVIYSGDENFLNATAYATLTVNKTNSTLVINGNVIFDYGTKGSTTVSFTNASGVNASVVGQPKAIVVVNDATITVSGLDVGSYTLSVTTIRDGNHNSMTKTANITVNKVKTELTADEVITTYNSNKNLVISLKDSNGNPVTGLNIMVDLNGARNYTTDSSGLVKISTKGLTTNVYEVLISFNGSVNYFNCSNTTRVSIYKESSIVDTKPLVTVYNVHKYLVVGLKDKDGNAIRNADAFIEIHGVTYKCRSDNAGNARLIIRLNPGKYAAKITFDDVNYIGFTQYVTVIVKKATPKLTAKKKTFKKSKKVKKYTVTLKDNNGKAMAKVKLTLKVKGKTYKAKTNAKGKAVFKIKKLTKKGKYKATVKFAGNYCYNKVTKKVKITVK